MLYKVKAGALQLTVLIITLIAILLSSFILYIHLQNRFKADNQLIKNTINTTTQGINYGLGTPISTNDTTTITLNSNTVKLHKSYWGGFEKIYAKSKIKNKTFNKAALIGGQQAKTPRTSLYLKDNYRALVVAGNTIIKGPAFLPEQGIKPGIIGGHSYTNSKLLFGAIKKAPKQLPELPRNLLNTLENTPITTTEITDFKIGNTITNSFLNPVKILFNPSEIILNEIALTGHIIIKSEKQITVTALAKLKDVILIAPIINIQSNLSGNFQAIASKAINVSNNVLLKYPSALILKNNGTNNPDNQITINRKTTVKGMIIYLGEPDDPNNYNSQILIKEKATIIGEIYCNQNIELLGTVNGTVYANNFITKQYGTIYQNHIFNGTIIASKLPISYSGILFSTTTKTISKWLY